MSLSFCIFKLCVCVCTLLFVYTKGNIPYILFYILTIYSGALFILVHRDYPQAFLQPQSTYFVDISGLWNINIILDCIQSSAIYKPSVVCHLINMAFHTHAGASVG